MASVTVQLRNIADTQASLGWSEGRTLVVDRTAGKAGGMGLGFSGSQLLSLAIGGCFCNTLRKAAHELNVALGRVEVDVDLQMDGDPLTATSAVMRVRCETADGERAIDVIERSRNAGMVSRALSFPVRLEIV